ncbi:uncharacterized protein LOC119794619 [Cyprinodon tularosa]|uniref:uncharacterized protein LOC119794619 n=1 Tax=Cyprinodon tularosa TaxID=77115 RepID=UPI0018E2253E|nr:uncharacterized protein LOC119794619 [Cyprinodon tularosa]
MEGTSSLQATDTSAALHAASLLATLNHQRHQGLFCDCVLRQRRSSDQLYHAHRCILAASSPVLACILSSSGALVELEDPSLSDSVLPSLLDYIYTGVLPCPLSQQDYHRLLSAARHMQMKELQDALNAAWLQIQAKASDEKSAPGIVEMYSVKETEHNYKNDLKTFKDLPPSITTCSFQRLETAPTEQFPNEETFPEACLNSASIDPTTENNESIRKHYANGHRRNEPTILNDFNTFSILENNVRENTGDYRQVKSPIQKDPMSHKTDKSEVHKISGVIQYQDESNSSDLLELHTGQKIPEDKPLHVSEDRKRRSSSSSSSPHRFCEAVPVICHSSRAAVLQNSEVSAGRPHNQALQPLPNMGDFSLSVSTSNDTFIEAISTECKAQNGVPNQDTRRTIWHTNDRKGNKDYNSNNLHPFRVSEQTCKSAIYNMNNNSQHVHQDSLQSSTSQLGEHSDNLRRRSKHQIESDFDSVSYKHQRLDCFECQKVLLATATQEQSKDPRAVISFLDTQSDSNSRECLEVEIKGEHSYSTHCLDVTDSPCKASEPLIDWQANIYKDDKSRKDDISCRDEYKVCSKQTLSASKYCEISESRKSSSPETVVPCCSLTAPIDHNLSGTARHTGQPYHGHIPYQDEPHEDEHKLSKPGLSLDPDELSDGVNTGSFTFFGQRSLSQYLPVKTEGKLDVNTKHDLDMSSQHGSEKEEKQFVDMETVATANHENAQMIHGSFIGRPGTFSESDSRRDSKDGSLLYIKECTTGVWVTNNTEIMAVFKPDEGKTKISTTPICSPLGESDCDRASMPSTVSVCIPSTLPAGESTDKSAHLSSPNHQPFQCSLCDRSFSQRGSLNRHVRSHLGVRPFPCPCCPMTFSRQYRVTEHMRVHQRCALGNSSQKSPEASVTNNVERPQI